MDPAPAGRAVPRARKPFTGCNACHSLFHVDPHGKASICKIGRDPNVHLPVEGTEGLRRLVAISFRSAEALTEPEFVPILDDFIGPAKCSRSTGDDTPY